MYKLIIISAIALFMGCNIVNVDNTVTTPENQDLKPLTAPIESDTLVHTDTLEVPVYHTVTDTVYKIRVQVDTVTVHDTVVRFQVVRGR